MSLCGMCQPVVALGLHAPAGRPFRTHVPIAFFWGGLCGGGGGVEALSTVDGAPPGAVWLPVGHLLPSGSNIASISPQSWAGNPLYRFTGTPR